MKNWKLLRRVLSILLMVIMLSNMVLAGGATENGRTSGLLFREIENGMFGRPISAADWEDEQPVYADDDIVRVSIVLDKASTIEAGFSVENIAGNKKAMAYRKDLEAMQDSVADKIERDVLRGGKLDIVWNLTLAANLISANVEYGKIAKIAAIKGVKEVVIEKQYEAQKGSSVGTADPNMSTSPEMIGSTAAWAGGYTGAGSRIAIIDTGVDIYHQSFDAKAFEYSLGKIAESKGLSYEEYVKSLKLLNAERIAEVYEDLNLSSFAGSPSAEELYVNSKIPFGYNYVDRNLTVDHASDIQGEHGSHVAGIAGANAYIPAEDGKFVTALESVFVQGVAPDAQIFAMKVFGTNGGAYEADYMAAIEDAIVLGADSINLSLGSGSPGFSRSDIYQGIMDSLEKCGVVVVTSNGNAYSWAENAVSGSYLYGDDVSFATGGNPGTYQNMLAVASVDNDGFTGQYLSVGGSLVFYSETFHKNEPFSTLAGDHEYILIDGYGTEEEFDALADVLEGKIAICSRGQFSFYLKAEYAVKNGAIATIIYNNVPGTVNMDLSDYSKTQPVISITMADADLMRKAATPVKDEAGNVLYYQGKMKIGNEIISSGFSSPYYTMSDFSSWGVPGSLVLKPEITAPGGNIYSINGTHKDTASGPILGGSDQYESMSGTSMASPQIAGMAALVAQHIREKGLVEKTGLSARQLAQSLLMSTAKPLIEEETGSYWSVLKQGSGLANVGSAISAESYIFMDASAAKTASDGKVKVELGDDPARKGVYEYSFTLNNISGRAKSYTLGSSFFTQDLLTDDETGIVYLNTTTTPIAVNMVYTVNGEVFVPRAKVDADVDRDGDTDADDAQAILDYVVGNRNGSDLNLAVADLDDDGRITSYDAYLILSELETAHFVVPADGSVKVEVRVALTDAQKAYLNKCYENGAYIEGYTFVDPVTTEEGEIPDVIHSIPVLGFYGNWSDPSMFDKVSYTEYLYGDQTVPYTGQTQSNNLLIRYNGDANSYYQIGNPFMIEESFPADRLAINTNDTLFQYGVVSIRAAAAITAVVSNGDGEILWVNDITKQWNGAYYYVNGSRWMNTNTAQNINRKVASFGVKNGDYITVSMVAVPEYYEIDGAITEEQLKDLITSNKLGEGAFLSTTMKIDNIKPELFDIVKDEETGNLVVTATDNNYIAAIQVFDEKGYTLLGQALPQQTEEGQKTVTTVDLQEAIENQLIHENCVVVVSDYANNSVAFEVEYGGEEEDFTGRFFAFTSSNWGGGDDGNRLMEIDPENVYAMTYLKTDGAYTFAGKMSIKVTAAEYVNGYVFMAATDGNLYVAKHNDFDHMTLIGRYKGTGGTTSSVTIADMAYSYKDNKLYALVMGTSSSTVYSIDVSNAQLKEEFTISVHMPNNSGTNYKKILTLTIDNEGNFYAANYGGKTYTFLYKWSWDDVVNGKVTDLEPVNSSSHMNLPQSFFSGSFAWDHENNKLYYLSVQGTTAQGGSMQNYLTQVNTETGIATKTNTTNYPKGGAKAYAGNVGNAYCGFYIPTSIRTNLNTTENATSITLSETSASVIKGATIRLSASLEPWTLANTNVEWTSSDTSVATVSKGVVTGVSGGTATITATTVAEPHLTATCEVTVVEPVGNSLKGLVCDKNGKAYWSSFKAGDLTAWKAISGESAAYYAGTLHDDMIYAHDGKDAIYKVDPKTFEATKVLDGLTYEQLWSDAASAPLWNGQFGDVLCITNNGCAIEVFNFDVEDGDPGIFEMPGYFSNDRMVTICYVGSGQYSNIYPAHYFYVLTESGAMWSLTYTNMNGTTRLLAGKLGNTGLKLQGVADMLGDSHASMVFDFDAKLLYVTYDDSSDNTTMMYAIEPFSLTYTEVGSFGMGVKPVVALYQEDSDVVNASAELAALVEKATAAVETDTAVNTESKKPADLQNTVVTPSEEGKRFAMQLTEDVDVTNGKITVSYDPSAFSFVAAKSAAMLYSVNEAEGTVTLAYANDEAITAGSVIATLYFERTSCTEKDITVTTDERNSDVDVNEASDVQHPDHIYEADVHPATCTEDGYTIYTCTLCGDSYKGDHVDALGHDYVTKVYAPTCTKKGCTIYICSRCNHIHIEVIDALGHSSETELKNVKEATCTEDGYTGDKICKTCGEVVVAGEVIKATGHSFGDWTTTKAPTCTEKGEEFRTCAECGHTETRDIEANGHSAETELKNFKEATCTEDGYTGDKVCKTCGEVLEAGEVIKATGHSFGDWTTSKEPTCTAKGEETRTCAECGHTETREIEATGHSSETELKNAKEATCTEDGYTGDKVCKTCGEVLEAGEVIKATGHSFGDWTTSKEPTCTAKGEEFRTCAECGHTETREIEATGHSSETELKNVKEATCTEDGYTGDKVCKTCGEVLEAGEVIKATGHSFGDWTTTKEPTCTEKGEETRTCAGCDHTETREIEATGHSSETELKNVKEATCTEDGYTGDKVCKTCGEVLEAGEVIKATGHSFGDWTTSKEPTCTEKGEETRTCAGCDHTETREIEATGHSSETELKNVKEATCTEDGYTGDKVCKTCGEVVEAGEVIKATGHDYESVVTEPTSTDKGYTTHTCKTCGDSYVDSYTDPTGNVDAGDHFNGALYALMMVSAMGALVVIRKKTRYRV